MSKAVERPANPADVESIEAIVAAAYDSISGPAGKKRDWDRMRSLFIAGARLIPTAKDAGKHNAKQHDRSNAEKSESPVTAGQSPETPGSRGNSHGAHANC